LSFTPYFPIKYQGWNSDKDKGRDNQEKIQEAFHISEYRADIENMLLVLILGPFVSGVINMDMEDPDPDPDFRC
jgi:hypothetical protein